MATAAATEETDEEECCVCFEHFKKPKILICGHIACADCLTSWLKSEGTPCCPLCRSAIVEEGNKSNVNFAAVVEALPTDLSLEILRESEEILSKDQPCQACVTQVAKTLCTSCGDFFCSSCTASHKRQTATRNHVTETLSTMTAEKLASCRQSQCSDHSGEVSQLFCSTHGALICVLCKSTKHRLCPDVIEVEKKVKEDCEELTKLLAILTAGESELEEAISQLDDYLKETEKNIRAAIALTNQECDRLDASVKANRKRLTDLAESTLAKIKKVVNEKKSSLLKRKGPLTSHKRVVGRARRVTKPRIVRGMTSSMTRRVQDLECSLPEDMKEVLTFTFHIDPEAVSRLEREITQLGEMKTFHTHILTQQQASGFGLQAAVFRFHTNHGRRVVLSNDQQTAQRTDRSLYGHGIVMSCDPMQVNMLYEVRVEETNSKYGTGAVMLGVVTQAPDTVTLPDRSYYMQHAVAVGHSWINVNGVRKDSTVGSALSEVKQGSRVGLMLDKKRSLLWYKDGQCMGVVAQQVSDPCHAMFDLWRFWTKVTALPVRRME